MSSEPGIGTNARQDFLRMLRWIALAGALMTVGALAYLSAFGTLTVHMAIATVLGVFLSVLLGCGLFAAAFFSDKSGHDQRVTDAARSAREPDPEPGVGGS